jgi:hypothetical protein
MSLIISSQILERYVCFLKERMMFLNSDNLEKKTLLLQNPIEMEDWKQLRRESLSRISTSLSMFSERSLKNLSEET